MSDSQIKDLYNDWVAIEEEIKKLREGIGAALTVFAKSRGQKKGDILKAFRVQRRLEDKKEDEMEIVADLIADIK